VWIRGILPRLNIVSWCVGRVFVTDEISMWICGLSKVDCPPQWGWISPNLLRPWIGQKMKERNLPLLILLYCFGWTFLTLSSLVLRVGFISLAPWISGLWTWTELCTTSFPSSPHSKRQIVGLLSFQDLTIYIYVSCIYIYIYIYIYISLENPN
jgi:hypothetical protein